MKHLLVFLAFFAFATLANAQTDKKSFEPIYTTADGAIRGYDPVAYFTEGKPVKGQADITQEWNGATWHFSSTEHRDSFQMSPEKFAPCYGGYCAFGWTRGYQAKIDPTAWTIVDNKLYLNYDAGVKKDWDKKQAEYIQIADKNYSEAMQKQMDKH